VNQPAPLLGADSPARQSRLLVASRGDALTPHLLQALERRYPSVALLDAELSQAQRLAVALATLRPSRTSWVEQFYKSGLGYRLRSRNATARYDAEARDPVLQVHALFEISGAPTMLYVDCTHRQSAEFWPAWNPLRGRALQRWYERETAAYAQAHHLFVYMQVTRRSLVDDYGIDDDRISVVGAGINTGKPVVRERPSGEAPMVLFIGNDFVRKGGPTLVRAFRDVRRQMPDARLVLVGTRPDLPAEPGVEVLGRIDDRARVLDLYHQASVFCLPSVFEPYGLVLLEAMAHGVPSISTPSVGASEIVTDGESGLLVPTGDSGRLAQVLLELLSDPERAARLGSAGRERVLQTCTWDDVVARMAPVLDDLLGA